METETQPQERQVSPRRRKRWQIAAGAVVVLAGATAGALALTSGPGSFTVKGTEMVCVDAPDITAGSQVVVTDSTGKVVADGPLVEDDSPEAAKTIKMYDDLHAALAMLGDTSSMSLYTFRIPSVPGGLSRYGMSAGRDRGTVWYTPAQMRRGPSLGLGC